MGETVAGKAEYLLVAAKAVLREQWDSFFRHVGRFAVMIL